MNAICVACGRQHQISANAPPANCPSCGGQLQPIMEPPPVGSVPPVTPTPVPISPEGADPANREALPERTIELAGESLAAGITCPNCGKWIEPGAQICTTCGYSRRLARTLTTRVGTPATLKPKSPLGQAPEIDAEKRYRRAKSRQQLGAADTLRLLVALLSLLVLGAIVMAAPTKWLQQNLPLKLPALLQPPKFDTLNATFMMLVFLGVALPITAIAVRIAAAIANIEIHTYFNWLRTAGVLAATLVTLEIIFSVDQHFLHWQTRGLITLLAVDAALTLVALTWYLHDLNFSAAVALSFAILIAAAVGLLAAAAAFGWVGNFFGINPVIGPFNTWTWPKWGS